MKISSLLVVSVMALAVMGDVAFSKPKHTVPVPLCPKITHYFSWFTTISYECPVDMPGERGNHNYIAVPKKNPI